MNQLVNFLGQPRTIKHQLHHRKISWLELFYDLMFSVVIARLTDGLISHLSWQGLGYSTLLFGWFLWGWNETSGYFDNHGNDSIINVLIINTEMILTGIGAIYIPESLAGHFRRVSIILMAIELLMALVWLGLSHFDRLHGPASRVWAIVHLFSLAIMVGSYLIGESTLVFGLTMALLLNIFDVVVANPRLSREYDQAHMKHRLKDSMIERYGLLTMIALGEVIAGLYEPLNSTKITGEAVTRFITSIILVALVAAIYYQVLGTLQIVLNSSIGTILTGWLFLVAILFAYYLGVAMQLVLAEAKTSHQLLGNLSLSLSLVAFLVVIRLIVAIGSDLSTRQNEGKIMALLVGEWIVLLALAAAPSSYLLAGAVLVLLAIVLQGRILTRGE